MKPLRLTLLALAILAASAVAGIAAYAAGVVDPGFAYGFSHDDGGRQTLIVASVRPGGLAWYEGVEPGFIVLSVNPSVNGGGIDEQLYTPPGAVEAQQAAAATSPQHLVFMAKPGELEAGFRADAAAFAARWHRTAALMTRLADSYAHDARREDAEADLTEDTWR